jgi:hypothetical protein
MKTEKEQLSHLVKDPELEKLELELKKPNFFNVLRVHDKEIRHSNFLGWLLNPNQGHNLSDLFLKWFLRDVFSDDKIGWADEFSVEREIGNIKEINVWREWKNIDIMIVAPKWVISIENKYESREHDEQLKRNQETIKKEFKDKKHGYVYLTALGQTPENVEDQETFVYITYEHIAKNVETILSVYGASLSDKVRYYIEDYLAILKRDIMKNDNTIELAQRLYWNHREAMDFIIDNKPDRLSEIAPIIEEEIRKKGYVLGTCNRGFARFLTPKLEGILPKTGNWWKNKESFLFELIYYYPGKTSLTTTISPGDEKIKQLLSDAISKVNGARKPRGKDWLVHLQMTTKIGLTGDAYKDENKLRIEIKEFLTKNETMIREVESEILKNKDKIKPD